MIFENKEVQQKIDDIIRNTAKTIKKDLEFRKINGSWYAYVEELWDTPDWQSTIMVSTFPQFLDFLWWRKTGMASLEVPLDTTIVITISNSWFPEADIYLNKIKKDGFASYEGEGYGADYDIIMVGANGKLLNPIQGWLCGVNAIVWEGNHPEKIFATVK